MIETVDGHHDQRLETNQMAGCEGFGVFVTAGQVPAGLSFHPDVYHRQSSDGPSPQDKSRRGPSVL